MEEESNFGGAGLGSGAEITSTTLHHFLFLHSVHHSSNFVTFRSAYDAVDDGNEKGLEMGTEVDLSAASIEAAIVSAINSYHELNPSMVDKLHEEPSPLEFLRYVTRNRPFVVRNAAAEWKAFKAWDSKYLREAMVEESVNVAITPFG